MIMFQNDYVEGAHPAVLKKLVDTNMEQSVGYGEDPYCEKARARIREAIGREDADVHFLVGGTQTNLTVISAALRPHQGALCAETGHIHVHETGSVEACGHKVLAMPGQEGKITAKQVNKAYESHWTDVTLHDLAVLTDAFYIGGTKVGALFGECVVINHPAMKEDFRYLMKQKGGMLAKGRLLGLQFQAMFENDLYMEMGRHADRLAMKLKKGLLEKGYHFYIDSITNQQFVIVEDQKLQELEQQFVFNHEMRYDENHMVIRICTSWATKEENLEKLLAAF